MLAPIATASMRQLDSIFAVRNGWKVFNLRRMTTITGTFLILVATSYFWVFL